MVEGLFHPAQLLPEEAAAAAAEQLDVAGQLRQSQLLLDPSEAILFLWYRSPRLMSPCDLEIFCQSHNHLNLCFAK